MSAPSNVVLRVRLAEAFRRQLQARAQLRNLPVAAYSDRVFRYCLQEGRSVEAPRPASMDDDEEAVYFELLMPAQTKQRLAERSDRQHLNLATYAGLVLTDFLQRFVRDPRDFATIYYLALRLDQTAMVTGEDLIQALALCERYGGVRLPPGYLAKWLHERLRRMVPAIDRAGVVTDLTLDLIEESLRAAEALESSALKAQP
jgi:hypothetical protein